MINKYTIQELENYVDKKVVLSEAELSPKQFDEPLRGIWNKYARIPTDISAVNLVYLAGFNGISDGTIKASETLSNWVRNIDRQRSANFIGGICASFLTAALEDFTKALAEYWFANCEDSENRIRSIGIDHLTSKDLKNWVSPTARSGRWFQRIERLFGYRADPEAVAIIEDMLKSRTVATHEEIGSFDTPTGERLKLWGLATRNLIFELLRTIKEKGGEQTRLC
ncbi:MAG: hypothetical protein IBX36_03850 [Dehalococcoidia bacterium]|nr:hypothetical protein [Dehalococcoidia bacterium]